MVGKISNDEPPQLADVDPPACTQAPGDMSVPVVAPGRKQLMQTFGPCPTRKSMAGGSSNDEPPQPVEAEGAGGGHPAATGLDPP
jgi:hypothetical protein